MPTQVFRLPDFYRETYDPVAQRTLVRQLELWLTSLGSEVNQLSAAAGPTGDFAPLVHQHSLGDIPDLASTYATKLELSQLKWGDLADVTTTGTPGLYAVRYTGAEYVLETLPPGSEPPNTYSRMFDGLQYTNASGSDTLRFRSADNKLSIAVFDNDATYGDNVRFTINQANIDHDALANFEALEHVDHSAVTLTAGTGLTGGGDISASRTFDLADTAVTPASYGTASQVPQFTVDQQGRLTLAANVAIAIDAAAVVSGQFLDALIQESNVTQHEAALTIDWPQLTNLPDIVYQSGSQVITGNKTFNVAQYFGANIEQTAGWFISSAGTRMGLGGLPNLTGSILQVYGSADIDGGSLNFRSGAAVNNVLYTGGLETMILRNFGTEPSTLLEIRSKAGNPLTDIREATLALTRTDDAGNAEFIDLYNNGYHTGSPASVQHGLRIQKRGTGEYRPFVFDWYDGTTYTPGFTADSVTGFDFSLDVAAPDFVEGGTSLAAKYAPIVHDHDDRYYTESEIDAFLLNYNPVENGFVSRAETTISFVDGTRTFTITPTGASFEFWASGDRFVKSGPESIAIPDIEGIHFIYYDDTGTLQVVQVFNLDIIATFCFVAAVYWDATNNVSIIFGDERHGRQMDSATHLWAHASFGALYGNGFQPGNLSMDGNGNSAAHAQLSVSNGQFRDEDITHDITDGSPQELDPILQAPVLYRSGANGDWRKVAATDYPVTTAGSGRAAYNLFSGGVWSLAEAGNNNYVLIHLFATNDTRHPIVSIAGQNEYNNLNDARSAAPLELNELQFGGLASLLLEFIPIATFIVQTASGMSNAVKSAFRTTEEGDDFIDWREQRSVSGTGASSSNHSNLSGLGNDDHPQYHTDARGDLRYSQLGHTHPISDVTNLQTELDGKEPDLGVPAADGYVLASTAAGVRSWVEMTGGAGGALGDLSDVTLTSPSVGQFLRYSGAAWLNTVLAAGDIPSLDAAKITTGTFLDARIPNLNTSKLTAGTLGVARGGTGISSFTALNYIRAAGATALEQRTPAQVLSDIGAAAASHTHTESQITDLGDYLPLAGGTLTGDLIVDGSVDHIIDPSFGFVLRGNPGVGGWARGLVVTNAANTRIGGAGFLGTDETIGTYHIGFGGSWWATDSVFEVNSLGNLTLKGSQILLSGGNGQVLFTDGAGTIESRVYGDTSGNVGFLNAGGSWIFRVAQSGELAAGTVPWARLTGIPSTFTPSAHTHPISDITSLQGTLDDKVSISTTHLGRTGNFSFDSTTDTAAEWAALPVGYSRMFSIGIGTAGGAPVNNYGYFTKVANRDSSGGWGGLWVGYAAGQNYVGRASTSADFASWDLLWSSANLDPSDYLPLAGGTVTGVTTFTNTLNIASNLNIGYATAGEKDLIFENPNRRMDLLMTTAGDQVGWYDRTNSTWRWRIGAADGVLQAGSVPWARVTGAPSFLTGNQTITLTGDASGSGTTSISVTVANDSHTHDGRYYTESESDAKYALLNDFRAVYGALSATTTAALLAELLADGQFDSYLSSRRTSWSYAGNGDLSDAGRLTELAGTAQLWWTDNSSDGVQGNITGLVIAPNTGGSAGGVFIYNDQGSTYSPGWREVWTSASDGAGSGLDADLLDGQHASAFAAASHTHSYLPLSGGTLTGVLGYTQIQPSTTVSSRDKVRVYPSSSYAIGMASGYTFGAFASEWVMTFQMNNASNRGFWFGDEGHTAAQGAMGLTTDGRLTLASRMRVGYGETDTTAPSSSFVIDAHGPVKGGAPVQLLNSSTTLSSQTYQDNLIYNTTAGITFTLSNTVPIGTQWQFHNRSTGNITIATGGNTVHWMDGAGAAPSTGNRTLAQAGVATAVKIANAVFHIYGAGLS